jgi:putative flippase GtrA
MLQQGYKLVTRRAPVRYVIWSGFATATNVGLSLGLHEWLDLPAELAFAIALALMLIINFCGLRYFVYRSRAVAMPAQFASYAMSAIGFRVSEYIAFLVVHTLLGCPYRLSVIGVLAVSFVGKYSFYKHVVFLRRKSALTAAPVEHATSRH